jgi:hypothetical protein
MISQLETEPIDTVEPNRVSGAVADNAAVYGKCERSARHQQEDER